MGEESQASELMQSAGYPPVALLDGDLVPLEISTGSIRAFRSRDLNETSGG